MDMMARTIFTKREEKNRLGKAKGVRESFGAKAFAAERPLKKEDKPTGDKTKEHTENAAPALAKPNPKAHAETGKGKDRVESKRDRER